MKIIRYVVKADTGLAPNPFHGWCTLAVCTPNHQRAKVDLGDWIVGNSDHDDGYKLIYAMRVDRIMDMDEYFNAPEFQAKKPEPYGTIEQQRGDNIYFKDKKTDNWRRLPSMFHNEKQFFYKDLGTDLNGRQVFAGQHFFYFGKERIAFPDEFAPLIASGRGIRTFGQRDQEMQMDLLYGEFVKWLEKEYQPGRMSMPRHVADVPVTEPMVTSYLSGFDDNSSLGLKGCAPSNK